MVLNKLNDQSVERLGVYEFYREDLKCRTYSHEELLEDTCRKVSQCLRIFFTRKHIILLRRVTTRNNFQTLIHVLTSNLFNVHLTLSQLSTLSHSLQIFILVNFSE